MHRHSFICTNTLSDTQLNCTHGFLAPGRGNDEPLFGDFWELVDFLAIAVDWATGRPLPIFLGKVSSFLAASAKPPKPNPLCLPGPPFWNIATV